MFKFQNILFPIEFSQRCEAAAPFVLSMAQRYQARVVLLNVLRPPAPIYAGMDAVYPQAFDFEGAIADVSNDLRKFAAGQLPKVEVECVVEPGEPAYAISQYAFNKGMHLIAMPTHGYGTFRRALLGSVTAKVLHDSTVPVWTAAHAPEPSHRAHPKPRYILCALDMKQQSRLTLEVAISLASEAGASLEIVHVPAETVSPEAAALHLQEVLVQAASAGVAVIHEAPRSDALRSDSPRTATMELKESSNVAEALRNLALNKRADLVVIGRGAIRTGLGRFYANSYDIIRDAPCPVLSV